MAGIRPALPGPGITIPVLNPTATLSDDINQNSTVPKISVIEVGAGNSYGHPTSATLGRLAQAGSAVYRTDLNGDVMVTTDGIGLPRIPPM